MYLQSMSARKTVPCLPQAKRQRKAMPCLHTRKHCRTKGFTLVEVLITMSVLSLVVLTGAWAYSFMSQNWQRNQQGYQQAYEQYSDWKLVQRAVSSTFPKLVRNNRDTAGFYFLGRDNGFTAVTHTSVQNPDYPAVYRLFREPDPESDGWQLVYEEAVLYEALTHVDQQLPFNFRLVIQTELPELLFEYYGWESNMQRAAGMEIDIDFEGSTDARWYDEFDAMERDQHPIIIQVHIGDFIWPVPVPDTSSELYNQSVDTSV